MVGVIVNSMDFLRIDFNPCPSSRGNPTTFLSGTARCKPTTMCVPLAGYGFVRGGYMCVCQPGYRLPMQQNGPFRGFDIEVATELEYKNGFDCLPVGWREVVPHEISTQGGIRRYKRSLFSENTTDTISVDNISYIVDMVALAAYWSSLLLRQIFINFGFGSPKNTLFDHDFFHRVDDTVGFADANPIAPCLTVDCGVNFTLSSSSYSNRNQTWPLRLPDSITPEYPIETSPLQTDDVQLSRTRRQPPFYYIGGSHTFDQLAYDEVMRLLSFVETLTPENCHSKPPEQLVLPGGVSYGAELQFEMEGRVALRLAHFLSAYYQNNIVGELYGNLKSGAPLNRFELFGEVYANVFSSFDIVSSGIFFDHQAFTGHDGATWDLFAPYAYKPSMSTQVAEAIDMSLQDYRNYTQQPWFRILKERWVSSRFGLEKITTKPYIRSNINGSQVQRYFNFPLFYRVPRYEDGYWTEPYYVCDDFQNGWVITYAAPFFGFLDYKNTLDFMGVVTVSVNLRNLDINQCPQSFYTPNFFKNTARCDFKNTYCEHIPGRRFRSGSYKCMCRQGFEYPFNDISWFFDGETMEREYELKLLGKPSRYDILKCRQGLAVLFSASKGNIFIFLITAVWEINFL